MFNGYAKKNQSPRKHAKFYDRRRNMVLCVTAVWPGQRAGFSFAAHQSTIRKAVKLHGMHAVNIYPTHKNCWPVAVVIVEYTSPPHLTTAMCSGYSGLADIVR